MITFDSVEDVLTFVEGLDGYGLALTDEEVLEDRITELLATNPHGNDPAFIIKLKDLLAPGTISDWITRAEMESVGPEKIASAQRQLRLVTDFQAKHPDQCQIPD